MNEETKMVLYRILWSLQREISDRLEQIINESEEEKKASKERIEGLKEAVKVIEAFIAREGKKE